MKSRHAICSFLLCFGWFAFGQDAAAPSIAALPDPIEAYLQPLVNSHTIAGAVTLVATKDRTLYLKPIGYRDLSSKAPMPADAMFWIASTSKPMTVTAVMMLVDEGKIHLDDPVGKYLPEFKGQLVRTTNPAPPTALPGTTGAQAPPQLVPAVHPIRIREILSHTSGLPFHSAAQPGALDLLPLKDAVKSFASEPLLFQPGTNYSYSNEGINTAARIIEVVTGIPYEQFMQERLFTPLGMKDTTFWPTPEQIGRLAKSYRLDKTTRNLAEQPIEQLTYPLDDRQRRYPMPAGGLFSTASDVSIFCRMILNGGVLDGKRYISQASLREMTTEQNGGLGKTSYGFGWSISASGFGHGGAYKNAMEIDVAKGRILVFMVQQNGPWGTTDGDGIVSNLERLSDAVVDSHDMGVNDGNTRGQTAVGQDSGDALKKGFEDPPDSARPLVWWHWMNGNISKEGIRLDLEWMHRVGIAGFQNFDAALSTPQVVPKRLAYMTPEWKDAFKYAITLGDQFGMEMAIAGSPGWSESGGPWVPASHAMKKYVWSETPVEGGKSFTGKLAHPPTVTGPFQNIALSPREQAGKTQFYADAAVVAFPVSAQNSASAKITSSSGQLDAVLLTDGDLTKAAELPIPPAGSVAWIQFEYAAPQTIRSITWVTQDPGELEAAFQGVGAPAKTLEASDDGKTFRKVLTLEGGEAAEHTVSFAPVKAKFFRVTFTPSPRPQLPSWAAGANPSSYGIDPNNPPKTYKIAELVLHSDARVNRFEEKAAFVPEGDLYPFATPSVDAASAIAKSGVIDLTAKMQPDGTLDWTPPAGRWMVLRIGYSLLGITNHPATPEATGLEVDKLDRRYVKDYFDKYLDSYKEAVGADWMGKRGIRNVINDSWEAGSQNWTDNMLAQFQALRGYDATLWLPVLTGRVVESAEASDRFLWDFRKTIADLIANEHYGQLEATLHERGMGHYGESHEGGRAFVADGMEVKKFNEVPMSAMWTQLPGVNKIQYTANADVRESASVAHIYGQNLVAAESMTASAAAPWAWSPATLKPTADAEMLAGVNRFVIHESTHQPLIGKAPGLTLGPYGQWFNRNETWAEQARPWIDYLARSDYLLQQGRFGADVLYFYGEDSNLTAIFGGKSPDVPAGYGFDYINADGLIHEISIANGQIIARSGMQYKVLYLDPYSRHMSLPVLRAIHTLVENGARLAGPKPTDDPSQADDQGEFLRLSTELFGDGSGVHKVGNGTVYAGRNLSDVFTALHVRPDFDYTKDNRDGDLEFVHRKLTDGDIYFIDNRSDNATTVNATFRVAGKQPELWRAETGTTEPVSFKIENGRTTVPLRIEPWGTVFVVFAKTTSETSRTVPPVTERTLTAVSGSWTVSFEQGRGAPASTTMEKLSDWSLNTDPGVKYFSGIATYNNTVKAPPVWFGNGARLLLDLGDVRFLATVTVNGKYLGEVWHAPYRVDVTSALKAGANQIEVKVVNTWVNRLIGDEQPGASKITFTDVKPYKANSPLQSSGLLGPVTVIRADIH